MGVFDPDELFWRPSTQEPLTSYLSNLFGTQVGSLNFQRVLFPAACQNEPFVGAQSKLHQPVTHMGKSIVMPASSQIVDVHKLLVPESDFEQLVEVPVSKGY